MEASLAFQRNTASVTWHVITVLIIPMQRSSSGSFCCLELLVSETEVHVSYYYVCIPIYCSL